jgi:hypothetical protein
MRLQTIRRTSNWKPAIWFIILNMLDMVTTFGFNTTCLGREANPITASLLASPAILITYKVLVPLLLLGLFYLFHKISWLKWINVGLAIMVVINLAMIVGYLCARMNVI